MSVTYLMQYSVQYIIAPVIFDGTKKTEGLASLSMKKAKVEFTLNFLCDFLSVLFSSGDWALVSMQLSSPDATFWSDMDIQHATTELCMPSLCFLHLEFNLITSMSWVRNVHHGPSVQCGFHDRLFGLIFQWRRIGTIKMIYFQKYIYIYIPLQVCPLELCHVITNL